MGSTNINSLVTKVIITYDLTHNDISAQDIADASEDQFSIVMSMQNGNNFLLPNTTLQTQTLFTASAAVSSFKKAFYQAKAQKSFSLCQIKKIFACEVAGKNAYIENN